MTSMNNMKKEQKEPDSNNEKKVYIDSNCFIYAAIDEEEIGKRAKEIISHIKEGKYKAFTSTLTVDEFLWRVQKEAGRDLASQGADIFLTLNNLELINIDKDIISKMIEIYKTEKIDPRDAIHYAAMKQKNISIIISSDSDFDKLKGIKRIDFTRK